MTFGELWLRYNTPISLFLSIVITLSFAKIPRLTTSARVGLTFLVLFLLTGLMGVLKFVAFLLAVLAILYGAFVSIWALGILAFIWLAFSMGWHLTWWQVFIVGAVWGPISMVLDVAILIAEVAVIRWLGIPSERLPARLKARVGAKSTTDGSRNDA